MMAKLYTTKEMMTAKIGIVVRDKVFLIPNGVVLIPKYGIIQYRVEKWRNGKPAGALCVMAVQLDMKFFAQTF